MPPTPTALDPSDEIILTAMERFPSLKAYADRYRAAGCFRPGVFTDEFTAAGHGSGAHHAYRFILALWNGSAPAGNFDAVKAMQAWDSAHAAAFLAWVDNPEMP